MRARAVAVHGEDDRGAEDRREAVEVRAQRAHGEAEAGGERPLASEAKVVRAEGDGRERGRERPRRDGRLGAVEGGRQEGEEQERVGVRPYGDLGAPERQRGGAA